MSDENPISEMPASQLIWLDTILRYYLQAAPASDFQPYVWGGNIDENDCLDALRDEVAQCGSEVFEAVLAYPKKKRWPRLSKRAKFELRERLVAALELVETPFRAGRLSAIGVELEEPPECSQVLKELLLWYWDATASHEWAKTNSSCIARPHTWDEKRYS